MALTKKTLDALRLPDHVWWTEDKKNAYVCETVLGNEAGIGSHELECAVHTVLGEDHGADVKCWYADTRDPSLGWIVEVSWRGWKAHRPVYLAQSLTGAEAEAELARISLRGSTD